MAEGFDKITIIEYILVILAISFSILALYGYKAEVCATLAVGLITGLTFNMQRRAVKNARVEFLAENERIQITRQLEILKDCSKNIRINHVIENEFLNRMKHEEDKFYYLFQYFSILLQTLDDKTFLPCEALRELEIKSKLGEDIIIDSQGNAFGLEEHRKKVKVYVVNRIVNYYVAGKKEWERLQSLKMKERRVKIGKILIERNKLEEYVTALINVSIMGKSCSHLSEVGFDTKLFIRSSMTYYERKMLDECWLYLYKELNFIINS